MEYGVWCTLSYSTEASIVRHAGRVVDPLTDSLPSTHNRPGSLNLAHLGPFVSLVVGRSVFKVEHRLALDYAHPAALPELLQYATCEAVVLVGDDGRWTKYCHGSTSTLRRDLMTTIDGIPNGPAAGPLFRKRVERTTMMSSLLGNVSNTSPAVSIPTFPPPMTTTRLAAASERRSASI